MTYKKEQITELFDLQRVIRIIMASTNMDGVDEFAKAIGFSTNKIYDIMSSRRKKNEDVIKAIVNKYPQFADVTEGTFILSESEGTYQSSDMLKKQLLIRLRKLIQDMEQNSEGTGMDNMICHEIKSIVELYISQIKDKFNVFKREN